MGLLLEVHLLLAPVLYQGDEVKEVLNHNPDSFASFSKLWECVLLLFVIPLVEEFIFRFHLKFNTQNKKRSLIIFSLIIIVTAVFFSGDPVEKMYPMILITSAFIISFISIIKKEIARTFLIINILLSAVAFALVHNGTNLIENYSIVSLTYFLHFIGASFVTSYLRIKFGFIYSVLYHFIWNIAILTFLINNVEHNKTISRTGNSCVNIELYESGYFDNLAKLKVSENNVSSPTLNVVTLMEELIEFNKHTFLLNDDNEREMEEALSNYTQKNAFTVYNIKIKKSCDINLQEILELLEEEGIIMRKDKIR